MRRREESRPARGEKLIALLVLSAFQIAADTVIGRPLSKLSSVFPEPTRRSISSLVERGQVHAPETRYEVPVYVGARGEDTRTLMLMTLCNQLEEVSHALITYAKSICSLNRFIVHCLTSWIICWLAQITIPKVIFLGPQKETADSNTFVQLAYYLHSSKGIPETDKERKAA